MTFRACVGYGLEWICREAPTSLFGAFKGDGRAGADSGFPPGCNLLPEAYKKKNQRLHYC